MTEVLLQPLQQHSWAKELSTRSLARVFFFSGFWPILQSSGLSLEEEAIDRIILSLEMKSSLSIHAQANQTAAAAAAIFYESCTFLLG